METEKPTPQQLDVMVAAIRNIHAIEDRSLKQELIESALETLDACHSRREITESARKFMRQLLWNGS